MTYYSVAGSPPVTKNPELDSKRLKNETDREYKDRMFDIGIYTLPECKFDYKSDLYRDHWCVTQMDSCCFRKLKGVCRGRPKRWGKCKEYRGIERDGPVSRFLNTTL
ncbi:hypothetical protein HDE_05031 [Halotydeus destructor]|nr:hypothetical protein HDE_05031 [Halotydeus destructor]